MERIKSCLLRKPRRLRGDKIIAGLGLAILVFWLAMPFFTNAAGWLHPNVLLAAFLTFTGSAELVTAQSRKLAALPRPSSIALCVVYLMRLTAWVIPG